MAIERKCNHCGEDAAYDSPTRDVGAWSYKCEGCQELYGYGKDSPMATKLAEVDSENQGACGEGYDDEHMQGLEAFGMCVYCGQES